jgi:hypothetical protein
MRRRCCRLSAKATHSSSYRDLSSVDDASRITLRQSRRGSCRFEQEADDNDEWTERSRGGEIMKLCSHFERRSGGGALRGDEMDMGCDLG